MKKLLLALLLIASPAGAADGDFIGVTPAVGFTMYEWKLCDDAPGATCPQFDLLAANGSPGGLPDYVAIYIRLDNCTTTPTTFTPRILSHSGGIPSAMVAAAMSTAAVSRIKDVPATGRYYDVTGAAGTGGTCNDAELVLAAFYSN